MSGRPPLSPGMRLVLATTIAAIFTMVGRPAAAQSGSGSDLVTPLKVESVETSSYPSISVVVSAPRRLAGTAIPTSAFVVTENGRRRSAESTRLPDDELDVVLAIDTSGSMRGAAMDAAKVAASTFIAQMPATTRIAVVGFGSTAYVASSFSASAVERGAAIAALQANGETAVYDALLASADLFAATGPQGRRIVVLLSDGGDTRSQSSIDVASSRLALDGVRLYAVALLTAETDIGALTRLADATGGRVVAANNPAGLTDLYDSIAAELSNQYLVEYRARSQSVSDVQLTLDHAGVRARADFTLDLEQVAARAPEPVRAPPPVAAPGPGLFERGWTVGLGAVAVFAALALLIVPLLQPRPPRRRLAAEEGRAPAEGVKARVTGLTGHASDLAERALERRGRQRSLSDALERSGIALRPGEWVLTVAGSAFAALLVGMLLGGPFVGVPLAVATIIGFRLAVQVRTTRRRRAFADQLSDTLQLLASSLRAGHSLLQAIDALAQEAAPPTSDEFRRLLYETRLGRPLPDALQATAERVDNEDFGWVVQAIEIHREVGGDLAELLDKVAATIRDRNRVRRQVEALTAEGRLSAVILFALPIAMAALIHFVNRDYLKDLTDTSTGRLMIAGGVALLTVGGAWLRRLCRLVF
jgi:tight adherence protein B